MTNSDIRTARREAAIQNLLIAAREGNEVYNVDFNDWKDMAGRVFEGAVSTKLRSPFFHCGEYENRTVVESAIEDAVGFGLHTFPSKKLLKLLNNHLADLGVINGQPSACIQAVMDLITEFQPVRDAIKTLKPNVIKGRKPSTDPSKTAPRTIENTGTCAVCGQNVKLSGGKIVSHGYRVIWNSHQGNCYGVDYEPIEISPKGAIDYLASLESYKADQEAALLAAIEAAVDATDRKVKYAPQNIESMIRHLTSDIETFTNIITKWEATALPDTK
jgi:hypothetical protein